MARADLLTRLVRSGLKNDKATFMKAVAAIIAEERQKRHAAVAEKLEEMLKTATSEPSIFGNNRLLDTSMTNLFHEVMPELKFSDLVLPKEVQEICQSLIEEQNRAELLRSHNVEPRNRVLLIGPPGNGKTSLAEAFAETMHIPLLVVRYESVVGSFLGETASRLRRVFDYVATRRCALFFDEFETVAKERGDLHETGEIKRMVSSLLMQVDSLPSYVMVIGATNHAELLDRAVWRRFQVRMELSMPNKASLTEWFIKFERRIRTPLGHAPDYLAERLANYNFAEVEEFGVSAYRQYLLGLPYSNLPDMVAKTLETWPARTVAAAGR
ncbi:MAG: ATP-binding protein [Deltaproteobacteria bacterium]|jgi:SpoVK/Ycf46/Vps4 family AAA+-type ATPase|nr:ATP-binding protein [Deltaproteobacteria bacterium]